MLKHSVVAVAVVSLVAVVLFGCDVFSYTRTAAHKASQAAKEVVPLSFEIDRARQMVGDLKSELRGNLGVIAREEVAVDRIQKQYDAKRVALEKQKKELLKLQTDLKSGKKQFEYGGRKYTTAQVEADLAARFQRYKTEEATLASQGQMHQARQAHLDAARRKFDTTVTGKRQLEVDLAYLDARREMLSVSKATPLTIDESCVGRAQSLVADLKSRLDVAERLAQCEDRPAQEEIPVEQTNASLVDQIEEYFKSPVQVAGNQPSDH